MVASNVREEVIAIAQVAKKASVSLAQSSLSERNAALEAMASALRENVAYIVQANGLDVCSAREAGTKESLVDRLLLNEERIEGMASALEDLVALRDPLGVVQDSRTLYNGIEMKRLSVPLGVVAVVYEARPNVTADAAGICLKSGNAAVLRGGSLAFHSNQAVTHVLHEAAVASGMPEGCIGLIASVDRSAADELMQLHGIVDVLIPRGGAGLIKHCVDHSKVPVIETGTGNCHIYVHESAPLSRAEDIVLNAKCRRYGVCNAAESLLVDSALASAFLPNLMSVLADKGVLLHCDEEAARFASQTGLRGEDDETPQYCLATEQDWETEYLAPELAIKCVSGVDEAIDHINRYGTKHSEAIVADEACERGQCAIDAFLARVDASAVYANASTAFTDGGQFGLGAEIGISTQKLHARGPFALDALTSYKYVLRGSGQVRA